MPYGFENTWCIVKDSGLVPLVYLLLFSFIFFKYFNVVRFFFFS